VIPAIEVLVCALLSLLWSTVVDINVEVLCIKDCMYVFNDEKLSHDGRSANSGLSIYQVPITEEERWHNSLLV